MALSPLDLAIVALYLVVITLFGLRFRTGEKSLRSYFLAQRTVPWWAIALSIVSAETSTLTIISIPGLAYDANFNFLQVVFGYLVARVVISAIFLPAYFQVELFTAYQLIDRRFGHRLHKFTSGMFLITRAVAEGVRVFAISIVVNIALERYLLHYMSAHATVIASIALVMTLTLIYTFEGGMTAVIWTDVVQMTIYISGTVVGFITILNLVPGGWTNIHETAAAAGKFQVFDFVPSLTKTFNFWAGLIGGTFLTTASHGTDQLMVQRLLCARTQRESKFALLSSGAAILLQFTLFLLVGAVFWGVVLFALALMTQFGGQRVLELGLTIASVPYGGLLGVFLLGVLTKRANESGAIVGLLCGLVVNLFLWLGPKFGLMTTVVAWTWYVTIGTTLTFVVGYFASMLFKPSPISA